MRFAPVSGSTVIDKMSVHNKERNLKELNSLIEKAITISNLLIPEEPTHSKNQNFLYKVRENLENSNLLLSFVNYKQT